jgi:hypothetical protein
MAGVILIAKPPLIFGTSGTRLRAPGRVRTARWPGTSYDGERFFAVCVALIGAVFAAASFVTVRLIGAHVDSMVLVQYHALGALALPRLAG